MKNRLHRYTRKKKTLLGADSKGFISVINPYEAAYIDGIS